MPSPKSFTVFCSVFLMCCSDDLISEQDDLWDVSENYTIEFRHGIYKSSVEIIEDTCTPSLAKILDETDLWPPPYSPLPSAGYGPNFVFEIYHLRSASTEGLYGLTTRFTKIREGDRITFNYPEDYADGSYFSNNFTRFCEGIDGRDYSSKRTLRSISADQFEVEIQDEWYDTISCDHQSAIRKHLWFPRGKCKERYKIIYKIDEDIPRECLMDVSRPSTDLRPIDPSNSEGSFYPYLPRETIEIACN